jgi:hypothetical protein
MVVGPQSGGRLSPRPGYGRMYEGKGTECHPRRSWTSTARWSTPTTSTPWPGSGLCARTASCSRCGASTAVDHYLDLLDARDLVDAWTDSSDVEATKPEPDLVHAAIDKAGGGEAVMVGDSTWDCEAARRAGIETVAVLTGGFSEAELREAGAAVVFESIEELRERVGQTPLGDGQGTRELPRQA